MKKYDITNWQARITELSRIDHIQQQPELAYQLAYCYIVGNQVDHALSLLHGLEQTIDSQPPTAVLTDELKVKIYLELAACYIKKNDFSQSDQYFVKMTDISSTLENFSHYENVILIETLFEKRRDKEFFDLLSIRNDLNESLESFEIPEDLQDYEQYAKSAKLLDDPMREAQVKLYLSMLDTDAYYIIKK